MFCPNCSSQISDSASFCPVCGTATAPATGDGSIPATEPYADPPFGQAQRDWSDRSLRRRQGASDHKGLIIAAFVLAIVASAAGGAFVMYQLVGAGLVPVASAAAARAADATSSTASAASTTSTSDATSAAASASSADATSSAATTVPGGEQSTSQVDSADTGSANGSTPATTPSTGNGTSEGDGNGGNAGGNGGNAGGNGGNAGDTGTSTGIISPAPSAPDPYAGYVGEWEGELVSTSTYWPSDGCRDYAAMAYPMKLTVVSIESTGRLKAEASVLYHGYSRKLLEGDVDTHDGDQVFSGSDLTSTFKEGSFSLKFNCNSPENYVTIQVKTVESDSGDVQYECKVESYFEDTAQFTDVYRLSRVG